jgi:hypothetical protein
MSSVIIGPPTIFLARSEGEREKEENTVSALGNVYVSHTVSVFSDDSHNLIGRD